MIRFIFLLVVLRLMKWLLFWCVSGVVCIVVVCNGLLVLLIVFMDVFWVF